MSKFEFLIPVGLIIFLSFSWLMAGMAIEEHYWKGRLVKEGLY